MYGTIARLRVSKANLDALRSSLAQMESRPVEGSVGSHLRFRAHLEADPEWTDGTWESLPPS